MDQFLEKPKNVYVTSLKDESNIEKRFFSESIHSHLKSNLVNDKIDKDYISSAYSNISHF